MTGHRRLRIFCSLVLVVAGCQTRPGTAKVYDGSPVPIEDQGARKILDTGNEESANPQPPMALMPQPQVQSQTINEPWMPQLQNDAAVTRPTPSSAVALPTDGSQRLGLVLGPGGLRSFGEIGFLQELAKE